MTRTRRIVQGFFLVVVLTGVFAFEANCERWCPFGGVEAIYTYAVEGNMLCSLGVSNFFILGGVLATALLIRRAFCGYMCPIGAISEWINIVGRRVRLPQFLLAKAIDRVLSFLKYAMLAVILILTYRAGELIFRGYDPCYALIGRHGEDITYWAYVVSGVVVVVSLFVVMPFCRWFCPLAAVLNLFSRFGWARIQRDTETCHDCGRCARRCPMAIDVDQAEHVTEARCISCLACVEACPSSKSQSKALHWGPRFPRSQRWSQTVLVALLLLCTIAAVSASYLVPVPSFVKSRGELPVQTAVVELQIENVTCRGCANLLTYFLERDDLFAVAGYLRIAAWPGPGPARVQITYDPVQADEMAIKQAITEPCFEPQNNFWRQSPFAVFGYDPLLLEL